MIIQILFHIQYANLLLTDKIELSFYQLADLYLLAGLKSQTINNL